MNGAAHKYQITARAVYLGHVSMQSVSLTKQVLPCDVITVEQFDPHQALLAIAELQDYPFLEAPVLTIYGWQPIK